MLGNVRPTILTDLLFGCGRIAVRLDALHVQVRNCQSVTVLADSRGTHDPWYSGDGTLQPPMELRQA